MEQQVYFEVKNYNVIEWYFLCVHPKNENYVILINAWTQEPKRFYKYDLLFMKPTEEEAEQKLISILKADIEYLEKK